MDGSGFDAWTRRRVGLAAGGLAALLLGVARLDRAEAAKKRKKKRCKKLGSACAQGGKRKCCGELQCDQRLDSGSQTFCCKTEGKSCAKPEDCCQPNTCVGGTCLEK